MSKRGRFVDEVLQRLPARLQRAIAGSAVPAVRVVWPRAYGWPPAAAWLDPLRDGFRLFARVSPGDLPGDTRAGVYTVRIEVGGEWYGIAIDMADHTGISREAVQGSLVYFKMQYRAGGYGHPNVVPGGFVAGSQEVYRCLPYLRALRDRQDFRWDVCGRFGLDFAIEIRRRGIERLMQDRRLAYAGGAKIRYREALEEVARSRVALDLPGNGPLCFRLLDYMAVGACVVAYPHHAELPVPLQDGVHVVYTREDLSDLAEICLHYRHHAAERERLMLAARLHFDRHLHHFRLAQHYLATVLAFAASRGRPGIEVRTDVLVPPTAANPGP
jgi:hypothetical protein